MYNIRSLSNMKQKNNPFLKIHKIKFKLLKNNIKFFSSLANSNTLYVIIFSHWRKYTANKFSKS